MIVNCICEEDSGSRVTKTIRVVAPASIDLTAFLYYASMLSVVHSQQKRRGNEQEEEESYSVAICRYYWS